MKETAEEYLHKAEDAAAQVKAKATDAYKQASDYVSKEAPHLKETADEYLHKAQDTAAELKDKATSYVRDAKTSIQNTDTEQIKAKVGSAVRDAKRNSQKLVQDAENLKDEASTTASGLIAEAQEYIHKGTAAISGLAHNLDSEYHITEKAKDALQKSTKFVQEEAPHIKETISKKIEEAQEVMASAKVRAHDLLEKSQVEAEKLKKELELDSDAVKQ